jgi:hypothetical protein
MTICLLYLGSMPRAWCSMPEDGLKEQFGPIPYRQG